MDLLTPGIGLIFWAGIIFLFLLFILKKFAWKPINESINNRNKSIEDALKQADIAREEMKQLKADNEKILSEARLERDKMLQDANKMKEKIIGQAKGEAQKEVDKIKKNATAEIEAQKTAAMQEIRNQVLDLSLVVAEKLVRKELSSSSEQERLVEDLLKDIKLN